MVGCHGQDHSIEKQRKKEVKQKGSCIPDMQSTAGAEQSGKLKKKSKKGTESRQLYFKVCYRDFVLPKKP